MRASGNFYPKGYKHVKRMSTRDSYNIVKLQILLLMIFCTLLFARWKCMISVIVMFFYRNIFSYRRSFWCDCFHGFSGRSCNEGPLCFKDEYSSVCHNGATCRYEYASIHNNHNIKKFYLFCNKLNSYVHYATLICTK